MSELIIIAGPNGSGKSTLKKYIENEDIHFSKLDWINADELKIIHNITEQQAFELANKMREAYLKEGKSFVTETVFSHPSKLEFIDEAKKFGYKVTVHFVTTENPSINTDCVSVRLQKGLHKGSFISSLSECREGIGRKSDFASKLLGCTQLAD